MAVSYAVTWQEADGRRHSGRLELGSEGLHLHGHNGEASASRILPYSEIDSYRAARATADRLQERPTLVVELTDGSTVRIASVAQPGIIAELSHQLATLIGAPEPADRAVIVVPLREDAREEAAALIRSGPPFDLQGAGLDRHEVYLTEREAIFVFEGDPSALGDHLAEWSVFRKAVAAWRPLVDGQARYGDPVFTWSPRRGSTSQQ